MRAERMKRGACAPGSMPAVVYGGRKARRRSAVNPKEINRILHSKTGHNTIFNLAVPGGETPVMIVDWQNDPIKEYLLHVDLKRIDLTQRITRQGSGAHAWRSQGREAAGRHSRDRSRAKLKSSACRTKFPKSLTVDVSRADDRPEHPRRAKFR